MSVVLDELRETPSIAAGLGAEEVLDYLRLACLGIKDSSRKLALVLEGGAMRGVYTCGSLLGMELAGCFAVFDEIFASSAGIMNAAHFLAGDGLVRSGTYPRALAKRAFYNPWRPWRMVDARYVTRKVLRHLEPLDMEKLRRSRVPLWLTMTDVREARGVVLSHQTLTLAETWEALEGAIFMPLLSGPRMPKFRSRVVADGGIAHPIPLGPALQSGATDIVVLLGRALDDPLPRLSWPLGMVCRATMGAAYPDFVRAILNRHHVRANQLSLALNYPRHKANVLVIGAANSDVDSTSMTPVTLQRSLIGQCQDVLRLLGATSRVPQWENMV